MSKLIYDLHTHTLHSHGKGSVRQNVEQAVLLGLKKVAITDHAPGHVSYGIRDMDAYIADVLAIKKEYAGKIEVLLGVELNLCSLSGEHEDISKYAGKLDVKLLGYHKFTRMRDVKSYFYYYLTQKRDVVRNTDAVVAALYNGDVDILTHPGYAAKVDVKEVARACVNTGTLFEINEKHSELSPEDIITAANEGARFIISSDAHTRQNVGSVENALGKFLASGLPTNLAVNLEE